MEVTKDKYRTLSLHFQGASLESVSIADFSSSSSFFFLEEKNFYFENTQTRRLGQEGGEKKNSEQGT